MLVHSSSLAAQSWWILAGHETCHIIPNLLSVWHVCWVCCPYKNWHVLIFQKLWRDPCNVGLCNIMVQHEIMIVDELHNDGPQNLMIAPWIQNTINKMCMYLLSLIYHCPWHNPTPPGTTRSTLLSLANHSPTWHHTRRLQSALNHENRDLAKKM